MEVSVWVMIAYITAGSELDEESSYELRAGTVREHLCKI